MDGSEGYEPERQLLCSASSESSSSVSSTATAPNLPGAGRTVGLFFDNVGARLESGVNTFAYRRGMRSTKADNRRLQVVRRRRSLDSISTNATASNLPGAGRTMGLLFEYLGRRLESVLNVSATRRGMDPRAVAMQIRRLCLHDRTTIQDRHSEDFNNLLTRKEKRKLSRLCSKLIGHARYVMLCFKGYHFLMYLTSSPVHSTQRSALEEMLRLVIEDPLIHLTIKGSNLQKLDLHYNDSDVLLSTARALGSAELAHIHDIWSYALSFRWKKLQYKEEEALRSLLDETFSCVH